MSLHYSKSDLKQLFHKRLRHQLLRMEGDRKAIRNRYFVLFPSLLAIFVLVNSPLGKKEGYGLVIIGLILLAIYLGISVYFKNKAYRKRYKKHILEKVFALILPEAQFHPEGYISSTLYDNSRLFTASYNRYHGEDLIIAQYKNYSFEFSEVHTKHISGSGKNRRERTVFKGIFFKADMPLRTKSNLVIIPDKLNKLLGKAIGGFLEDINFSRDKIIRLESPEFEHVFAIYGTDQIEARRILTPSIMEKILTYNQKTHKDISLSIQNGSLYMAIPVEKNLFEPRILNPTRFNDIVEVCQNIEILTEVFDHFEHIKDEVA